MPSRPVNSRLDDLMSWFAASVLVTAGVIYTLKLRPAPAAVPPRATPAQEPPTLQQRRAVEPGRGRQAHVPQKIPWRGWMDILVRTYREILDDRLLALAAGVAFYSLIALFPAIAAGVSSYALFADVATISKHLAVAADMWMWLSTIMVLVGAELNSEIEHQTARDSTVGPEKPLGAPRRRDGGHGGRGCDTLRSMEPEFRTHVHCLGKQVRYHLDLWRGCISPSKSDVPALSEAS
jgi:hypothetical protein